ncbi:MAG TPA: hypothetical protein PKM65_06455 [Spirochaetota bacterium]|nr:hypothetical protein [Spirochaetota bacterium]HNT10002.1 hypothetical protein [Spirochaetota bacterium]
MTRKAILAGIALVFVGTALYSSPAIMNLHRGLKRAGVEVVKSCADCHNAATELKQAKGQDVKRLYRTPACTGKGCHL